MSDSLHVTDETLQDQLKKRNRPLLIAFWAPWSNACRAMEPVLKEIAVDYAKRLEIGLMNVDENAHTPAEWGIKDIPHIAIIDTQGTRLADITGPQSKSKIVEIIEKNLTI
jgi:thioredoxin 1